MKSICARKNFRIVFVILLLLSISAAVKSSSAKYTTTEDVGSFNLHIEPDEQAFAVYSSDDNSLDFYYGVYPKEGEQFKGKSATAVYHNNIATTRYWYVENSDGGYTNDSVVPEWNAVASSVKSVNFDESFKNVTPCSTSAWFFNFTALESINLKNLNTSNVSNMKGMFYKCNQVTTLDLSSFNTENVTSMRGMFQGCRGLETLNISSFDTSMVTTMQHMFAACHSLEELDLSNFNTSKVTNMSFMFSSEAGKSQLTSLDLSNFDTAKVTTMTHMFNCCEKLVSLDLSSFNTAKVGDMSYMFAGCHSVERIYVGNWTLKTGVSSKGMFGSCLKIEGGNGTQYNGNHITAEYAHIDGVEGEPGYFTAKNHEHNVSSWSDNGNETHSGICSVYNEPVKENHTYTNGVCQCGKNEE